MNPNSDEFVQFLHDLGVEMEGKNKGVEMERQPVRPHQSEPLHDEPALTMLQQPSEYGAFYQLSLVHTTPQLRIVLPEKQGKLKFQIYLVQLSEMHPLASVFSCFSGFVGSREFERERETARWHLLHAIGEMMKELFWGGVEAENFPFEITVEEIM